MKCKIIENVTEFDGSVTKMVNWEEFPQPFIDYVKEHSPIYNIEEVLASSMEAVEINGNLYNLNVI